MRKFVLALVAAGSALAVATPAAAQYYPQPYGYGYGNGYDYNRGYADPNGLHRRIENVLRSLDGVRPDQRRQLYSEAINLDRSLRAASRNGFSPWEARQFDQRIYQLERHQGAVSWNGGGRYYGGNNGYYSDRGRRGSDDRWDDNDDD
jgi:hypothetical protein